MLVAAERLFVEHGVHAVSHRQISEASGQGNNAAVNYHFGTKTGLVRAIVRKHAERIEEIRLRMLAEAAGSSEVRDWVSCLVSPVAVHLGMLGASGEPTWFARFGAQVMTDPPLRNIMIEESLSAPSLHEILAELDRCLPDLPSEVRAERAGMASQLMVHTYAERERALEEGLSTPRPSWHHAASGLVDALTGMWTAPVSR